MKYLLVALTITGHFYLAHSAAAQPCEPSATRHVQALHGEVMGQHNYLFPVGDWTLHLESTQFGWDLRLRDQDNLDISQITPPFSGPNPRQIYGWHFRNKENTAENTGDVNAPQHLRLFQFSPELSGTGGYRPPRGEQVTGESAALEGRGALTILDMGLADLQAGQKARMNYLKFRACLSWPKTEQEIIAHADAKSPIFTNAEKQRMAACGLDNEQYQLSAWIMPRWRKAKSAGFEVAPIIRKHDQQRGLAICRADNTINVLGFNAHEQRPLKPNYYSFAQYLNVVESWEIRQDADTGDEMIILRQIEKSEVAIVWNGEQFTHQLAWHFVED